MADGAQALYSYPKSGSSIVQ
ncbi:hypothetical protein CCACVL1_13860, partial [Corchorus capsularis]